MCLGILGRLLTGAALIHKGNLDRLTGDFLRLLRQFFDLRSIPFIRWRVFVNRKQRF